MSVRYETYNGHRFHYTVSEVNQNQGKTANDYIDTAVDDMDNITKFIEDSKEVIPKYDGEYDALANKIIEGLDKISENVDERKKSCESIKLNITAKCKELDNQITASNKRDAIRSIPKDKGEDVLV